MNRVTNDFCSNPGQEKLPPQQSRTARQTVQVTATPKHPRSLAPAAMMTTMMMHQREIYSGQAGNTQHSSFQGTIPNPIPMPIPISFTPTRPRISKVGSQQQQGEDCLTADEESFVPSSAVRPAMSMSQSSQLEAHLQSHLQPQPQPSVSSPMIPTTKGTGNGHLPNEIYSYTSTSMKGNARKGENGITAVGHNNNIILETISSSPPLPQTTTTTTSPTSLSLQAVLQASITRHSSAVDETPSRRPEKKRRVMPLAGQRVDEQNRNDGRAGREERLSATAAAAAAASDTVTATPATKTRMAVLTTRRDNGNARYLSESSHHERGSKGLEGLEGLEVHDRRCSDGWSMYDTNVVQGTSYVSDRNAEDNTKHDGNADDEDVCAETPSRPCQKRRPQDEEQPRKAEQQRYKARRREAGTEGRADAKADVREGAREVTPSNGPKLGPKDTLAPVSVPMFVPAYAPTKYQSRVEAKRKATATARATAVVIPAFSSTSSSGASNASPKCNSSTSTSPLVGSSSPPSSSPPSFSSSSPLVRMAGSETSGNASAVPKTQAVPLTLCNKTKSKIKSKSEGKNGNRIKETRTPSLKPPPSMSTSIDMSASARTPASTTPLPLPVATAAAAAAAAVADEIKGGDEENIYAALGWE